MPTAHKDIVRKILAVNDRSVAWAIAILVEVSKGQKKDVEKAYDFMVRGRYFEPTSTTSRKKLTSVVDARVEIGDLERRPVRLMLTGSSTAGYGRMVYESLTATVTAPPRGA